MTLACAIAASWLASGAFDLLSYLRLDGTQLDLRGTTVADADLSLLDRPAFSRVRIVLLSSTGISDAALPHLAHLRVEELDLYRTLVTGRGLASLEGLPLRRLTLTGTAIDDDSLRHLARLRLEVLVAGDTGLTDAGLRWLRHLPVRRLDLSRTKVTDRGLAALGSLEQLEYLDLSFTDLVGTGLDDLGRAPRLRELFLAGTRVPAKSVERLQAAHPRIKVTTAVSGR